MRFLLLLAVAITFAVSASVVSKGGVAPEPVKAPLLAAIVRLHDMNGDFFCSGTIVSDKLLITAAHCVTQFEPTDTIEIRDLHNRPTGIYARVVGMSERADYAILRGSFRKFAKLKPVVDPGTILKGIDDNNRQIVACGFAWSGELFCSSVTDRIMMNFQIAGKGFLFPGMSGGPVIDVATGTLIGVNSNVQGPLIAFSPIVEIFKACKVKQE